jgi:hypothetical protein
MWWNLVGTILRGWGGIFCIPGVSCMERPSHPAMWESSRLTTWPFWCPLQPLNWHAAIINTPPPYSPRWKAEQNSIYWLPSASTSIFYTIRRGARFKVFRGHPSLSRVLVVSQARRLYQNPLGFDKALLAVVHPSTEALLEFYEFRQRVGTWIPQM